MQLRHYRDSGATQALPLLGCNSGTTVTQCQSMACWVPAQASTTTSSVTQVVLSLSCHFPWFSRRCSASTATSRGSDSKGGPSLPYHAPWLWPGGPMPPPSANTVALPRRILSPRLPARLTFSEGVLSPSCQVLHGLLCHAPWSWSGASCPPHLPTLWLSRAGSQPDRASTTGHSKWGSQPLVPGACGFVQAGPHPQPRRPRRSPKPSSR